MSGWERLDVSPVPGSRCTLTLWRRDDEFSIRVDGLELMNSSIHGSEEALARIGCRRVADRDEPRVLVGGLGMGFTLAAALRHVGSGGRVTVAELSPAVIAWNRGPLARLAGRPLEDCRVTLFEGDVADLFDAESRDWNAILLDVDNGPEGFTRIANDWLYGLDGLAAAFSSLRPHGVLAIWSVNRDRAFTRRLAATGFGVESLRVPAGPDDVGRHTIWIATRRELVPRT